MGPPSYMRPKRRYEAHICINSGAAQMFICCQFMLYSDIRGP